MRIGRRIFIGIVSSALITSIIDLRDYIHENRLIDLPGFSQGPNVYPEGIYTSQFHKKMLFSKISLDTLSKLLWAMQGITNPVLLFRTAPSAGGLYPVDLYVSNNGLFEGLKEGLYKYDPLSHSLLLVGDTAYPSSDLIMDVDYSRTAAKYGRKAKRYADIEVGHIYHNLFIESLVSRVYPQITSIVDSSDIGLHGDTSILVSFLGLEVSMDRLGKYSVEEILYRRRSRRVYADRDIDRETFETFLDYIYLDHAFMERVLGNGVEVYLNAVEIEGIQGGFYKVAFQGDGWQLRYIGPSVSRELYETCFPVDGFHQSYVLGGKLQLVVVARSGLEDSLTEHLLTGFFSQGIVLVATALGLASVTVGGFDNERLHELLGLKYGYDPKFIIPVGWPR